MFVAIESKKSSIASSFQQTEIDQSQTSPEKISFINLINAIKFACAAWHNNRPITKHKPSKYNGKYFAVKQL